MLKPRVPMFRCDLSVRLRDTAEKQVPAKLKPIGGCSQWEFWRESGTKYYVTQWTAARPHICSVDESVTSYSTKAS